MIFWLVYVTPNVGPAGKLLYAYLTYTLVMMLYSANNTPYSALMGVMTADASERSSLASYRFVGALVGQFIIQALPLPLVAKLGGGDSARGWADHDGDLRRAHRRAEPHHVREHARTGAAAARANGTPCATT